MYSDREMLVKAYEELTEVAECKTLGMRDGGGTLSYCRHAAERDVEIYSRLLENDD